MLSYVGCDSSSPCRTFIITHIHEGASTPLLQNIRSMGRRQLNVFQAGDVCLMCCYVLYSVIWVRVRS